MKMYKIKPYYDNDDISERKQQYYQQILQSNQRDASLHPNIQLQKVQQPKISLSSKDRESIHDVKQFGESKVSKREENAVVSNNQQQKSSIKYNQTSKQKYPSFSKVNKNLLQSDPQRYKALQQRAQLFKKLQLVTVGLPIQQNTNQSELTSKQYILPHYKSQKITQIRQQERKIKLLTAEMLENQKVIGRIKQVQESLIDRVNRIKQIDEQIYSKLDADKTQQIEECLRIAKNLLAQGESEDKIVSVLRKILY